MDVPSKTNTCAKPKQLKGMDLEAVCK